MFRYFEILVFVCLVALKGYAQDAIDPNNTRPLEQQLQSIAAKDKGEGTVVKTLEDACLALLDKHNLPEGKGKIYAKIAFIYSGKGYSSPDDMRIAKTAEYCRKALEYPLDPVTTAEMYARLAGSQMAYKSHGREKEFAAARKEAIVNCLTALKIVLDNNAPKERIAPPGAGGLYTIRGEPNDPARQKIIDELRQRNELSRAARQKWDTDLKLYILRRGLVGQCVDLYSHKPYNTEEFEKYARDILKDHPDAINELLTKVNERISPKTN